MPLSAGAVTAGGCLGILIPPSVLLIVYGATAGVSVVQLYAGAFFPGIMLAGLYVVYVIMLAKIKPSLAPPLRRGGSSRPAAAPDPAHRAGRDSARSPRWSARSRGQRNHDVPTGYLLRQLFIALLPALAVRRLSSACSYEGVTRETVEAKYDLQAARRR